MKKLGFILATFVALFLIACSNENDPTNGAPGKPAKLTINLQGTMQSKGIETKATTDTLVSNYTVYVFRQNGDLDVTPFYVSSASPTIDHPITTSAYEVYVLANVGDIPTSPAGVVNNKTQLLAAKGKLMNAAVTATTQTANNLWMEGNNTITWNSSINGVPATSVKYAAVTVTMRFSAAKIIVSIDTTSFTNGVDTQHVAFDNFVLLYAGQDCPFYATDANKAIQTNFYSGETGYSGFTGTGFTTLASSILSVPMSSGPATFYTFPNDGVTKPTILAARGIQNGKTYYYPVQFNIDDAGYTIEQAKVYTVTLKLKGNANNGGGGGGSVDPEKPLYPAILDVTVIPATWESNITINKDFN